MSTKATWLAIGFLSAIFFLHGHSFFRSREQGEGSFSAEVVATYVEQGSPERKGAMLLLGAYGLVGLFQRHRNRLTLHGRLGTAIVLFLLWALASIFWTDDLALTTRRLILLAMLWLGALGTATRLSYRQIMVLAFSVSSVFLCGGICAELFLGTFRPFQSGILFAGVETGYRFCGTIDPNAGAWELGIMLISAFFLAFNIERYQRPLFAAGITALCFLVLSKTRTSFAAAMISLIAAWSLVTSKKRIGFVLLCAVSVICASYLAFGDSFVKYAQTSMLLGREDSDPATVSTLTGRIPFWTDLVSTYVVKRPLAGYGFGAFWTPSRLLEFPHMDTTALNGYIDITLDLGLVGAGAYVLMLALGAMKSVALYRRSGDVDYVFIFSILIFYAIVMVNESINLIVCFPTFIVVCLLAKLGFVKASATRIPSGP